jgi:hypothetical protein
MSVESDFRAALVAHAALTALVSTRVAQNAVPQGGAYPLVVFTVQHQRELGINNNQHADACTITVQCWAETSAGAAAVADAVEAALAASATAQAADATVTLRETAFDPDLGLDAEQLSIEWWVV